MNTTPDLHFAFDVGHRSIGWAVLKAASQSAPELLGCGSVIFPADDCLAAERRGFRRQRRHIRATRLRIARLRRLLAHLSVLTEKETEAPGCAWPWLLAARVLRGGKTLTWIELWDVLRWYAHNRGYDGNKGWSRQEATLDELDEKELDRISNDAALSDDEKKDAKYLKEAKSLMGKHGTQTMSETWCAVCKLDPLGNKKSCNLSGDERPRGLKAAFPRRVIEREVERILRAHVGALGQVDDKLIEALMRDHTALPGPDLRLPKRYGQRVNGVRTPGGLLFGQLVPRFENRIIATCPITFQRVYAATLNETPTGQEHVRRFEAEVKRLAHANPGLSEEERREKAAQHAAEVAAKVPALHCPEFYRFRWAMQLANVQVVTGPSRETRRLTATERQVVNEAMEKQGFLSAGTAKHPGEFMKAVRAQTGGAKDNLDQMLALPDADKSLVLDPARKRAAGGVLGVLWPQLDERTRQHTLTNLRRGKAVTARALLALVPAAQPVFDHWWDGEAMKKPRKDQTPRTREEVLDERHTLPPDSGRAPYTRAVLREVADFVLTTNRHPTEGTDSAADNGPLFRSEEIRHAQLRRALDEQTNNHLVRHRLKLLERLHDDLLKAYAASDRARIARITIEVNRDLKEMSGKTAQEQAKEQGQQTAQFRSVEKKLNAAYEGLGVHLGPGLIRKGRIAEDLGWKCPYTGKDYDALHLLHRSVDKDHIIPRSQRASDSLDSLVITLAEINKWKGNRTAVQFVEQEQGKPVPGVPNVQIKTLANFLKDVEALETFKGHDDDQRRKKNRKRLLALRDYVEKEFTPGDLTKTSQLVRLGAQALHKHYLDAKKIPVITSLPGSVTGAVRKSWNLLGCLALANPLVLNPDDLDEQGNRKVHRKTEIRGITHLHHALDACVLAFASLFLPRDGGAWELLVKRRLNADEQRRARAVFGAFIDISQDGELRLGDLVPPLKEQIRQRLAERRVVQHLPADPSGLECKETVWRVFDPADPHPNARRLARWLAQAQVAVPAPDAATALIICRKRRIATDTESAGEKAFHKTKTWRWICAVKDKSALLGFAPDGDPAQAKLKKLKAVKVLGDNFGLALDPEPTLIRPHKVWPQLEKLRAINGGKMPRVLRIGSLIRVPKKAGRSDYRGVWMVRGVQLNQQKGFLVDLSPADQIIYRGQPGSFQNASVVTLLKCGMEVLRAPLCGVPPMEAKPE